jgi:hypothetical protein
MTILTQRTHDTFLRRSNMIGTGTRNHHADSTTTQSLSWPIISSDSLADVLPARLNVAGDRHRLTARADRSQFKS